MNIYRMMLGDLEKKKKERDEEKEYVRIHKPKPVLTCNKSEIITKGNRPTDSHRKKSFGRECKETMGCLFQAIVALISIIVVFCIFGFIMNFLFKGCGPVDVDHIHYERY